jgi:hypothetical protein
MPPGCPVIINQPLCKTPLPCTLKYFSQESRHKKTGSIFRLIKKGGDAGRGRPDISGEVFWL